MALNHRKSFRTAFSVCCMFLLISTAAAYDGPAGVTFRAPFIAGAEGGKVIVRDPISVRVKVRIDDNWSLDVDGKGRAFPDRFIATVADSEITFSLRNQSKQKVKTSVLIPFDSSGTIGTGFTAPFSISAFLNGERVGMAGGPELSRGMMKIRSYRVPVEIPAKSTAALRITASHPLATHPAWYRFVCTDQSAKFPDFKSLTKDGCGLEFEFEPADERLGQKAFKLEWKTYPEGFFTEQRHGSITFRSESIQWVGVGR